MRHLLALAILCGLTLAPALAQEAVVASEPDAALAARIFAADGPLTVERIDASPPGWRVERRRRARSGYIGSTWELANSVGYSGRPIDILVGVTPDAKIAGAELVRHNEPVLTLGISTEDIAAYVSGFAGVDLTREQVTAFGVRSDLPDVISRATVSTGVIRDAILRTARTLALGRGLVGGHGSIDRVAFAPRDWDALAAEGALAHVTVDHGRGARGARRGIAAAHRRGRLPRPLGRGARPADGRAQPARPAALHPGRRRARPRRRGDPRRLARAALAPRRGLAAVGRVRAHRGDPGGGDLRAPRRRLPARRPAAGGRRAGDEGDERLPAARRPLRRDRALPRRGHRHPRHRRRRRGRHDRAARLPPAGGLPAAARDPGGRAALGLRLAGQARRRSPGWA